MRRSTCAQTWRVKIQRVMVASTRPSSVPSSRRKWNLEPKRRHCTFLGQGEHLYSRRKSSPATQRAESYRYPILRECANSGTGRGTWSSGDSRVRHTFSTTTISCGPRLAASVLYWDKIDDVSEHPTMRILGRDANGVAKLDKAPSNKGSRNCRSVPRGRCLAVRTSRHNDNTDSPRSDADTIRPQCFLSFNAEAITYSR